MFSATDISSFVACTHTATLKHAETPGVIKKPVFHDPSVDLLRKLGHEHEQNHLRTLEAKGLRVVKLDYDISWADGATQTIGAIQTGADVVYQGVFLDSGWDGRPDFLKKVARSSGLGDWAYEVVEAKLARSRKAGSLIQLCFYSEMLARLQGADPRFVHVVLGGLAKSEQFVVNRYAAYFRYSESSVKLCQ